MNKKLVVTVGNGMMGDDGAGALLAQKIEQAPLSNWELLNGGSAPENATHWIREQAPEQVLIVDTADMDLPPGEIRLLDDSKLEDPFLMTTHTLPLTYFIASIREVVPRVDLLGIQPQVVAFGFPISAPVRHAVERVYECLKQDEWTWERL
jgi:hydrogenase 3 maturation protease